MIHILSPTHHPWEQHPSHIDLCPQLLRPPSSSLIGWSVQVLQMIAIVWIQKWRFERWIWFSIGQFSGSVLIFRGALIRKQKVLKLQLDQPHLPQSWKCRMGSCKARFLCNRARCHFHSYVEEGWVVLTKDVWTKLWFWKSHIWMES